MLKKIIKNKIGCTKTENRRSEQVLSWRLVPVGRRGCGERAWVVEYGANTMYSCMKMEK
jgi:hypothetical protein